MIDIVATACLQLTEGWLGTSACSALAVTCLTAVLRMQVWIRHKVVVVIITTTAIYSLGHGQHTTPLLQYVARLKPSTLSGTT